MPSANFYCPKSNGYYIFRTHEDIFNEHESRRFLKDVNSRLVGNRNHYLYIGSFEELMEIRKRGHQGEFFLKNILAQVVYYFELHDVRCICCYVG